MIGKIPGYVALLDYRNTLTEGVEVGVSPEAYVKEDPYLVADRCKSAASYSESQLC